MVTDHDRHERQWAPRIWAGYSAGAWFSLLRRYRFAVGPQHLHTAIVDSVASLFNSSLSAIERIVYRKAIAAARVSPEPFFIIGHWRSGTTLLHELLCLDPRHIGPTVYECCAPHHFLLTQTIFPRLLWFLLPDRRLVDRMEIDWTSAFEDEFALCLMGGRSPYETIAFPNSAPATVDMLDPDSLTAAESKHWRALIVRFLTKLAVAHPDRRLVLKSPPHSCRIRVLLELFPDARFVHIVRNPYDVFPSTKHLWRTLRRTQGLQNPQSDVSDSDVLTTFLHVHACVERDKALVPEGQWYELRYEDLLENPAAEMRAMYAHFDLGAFERIAPAVETYFSSRKEYVTNRYHVSESQREIIRRQWSGVLHRYGYDHANSGVSSRASTAACSSFSTSK